MHIIIIPYRDREKHLVYFLKHTQPLFDKILDDYKILVIEQSEDNKPFNRGKLLNIGASLSPDNSILFTQDVDTNPDEDTIIKYYKSTIEDNKILGIYTSEADTLGGIVKLTKNTFYRMNGFPNNYWGWGNEDRALQNRASHLPELDVQKIYIDNTEEAKGHFTVHNDCHKRACVIGISGVRQHGVQDYEKWTTIPRDIQQKIIDSSGVKNLTDNIAYIDQRKQPFSPYFKILKSGESNKVRHTLVNI